MRRGAKPFDLQPAGYLLRPHAILHRDGFQRGGIEHHVLDPLAMPRVNDVHPPCSCSDHRGIGELLSGLVEVVQHQRRLPLLTIAAHRDVQDAAAPGSHARLFAGGVVVNEQEAAVFQGHGVDPGIVVRQHAVETTQS